MILIAKRKNIIFLVGICLFSTFLFNILFKSSEEIKLNFLAKKTFHKISVPKWKTLVIAYQNLNDQMDYFNHQIKLFSEINNRSFDNSKSIRQFVEEFNERSE